MPFVTIAFIVSVANTHMAIIEDSKDLDKYQKFLVMSGIVSMVNDTVSSKIALNNSDWAQHVQNFIKLSESL